MVFSSFVPILIAMAIVGYSIDAAMDKFCDDELLCVNKPEIYDTFQPNIDKIIAENRELMHKTNYTTLNEARTTGDEQNCIAETEPYKPYVIKMNDSAHFVVQSNIFEQIIQVTRCKKIGAPCFDMVKDQAYGRMKTSCEQKRAAISIYIYENNTIQYKQFPIPICCVCQTRFLYKK